MRHSNLLLAGLLVTTGLALGACSEEDHAAHKVHPAEMEKVAGTEFNRLTLTEKAIERTGIETAEIGESDAVRKYNPGGVVVAWPAGASEAGVLVRVPLSKNDMKRVDRHQPAKVMPAMRSDKDAGLTAVPLEGAVPGAAKEQALYYVVQEGGDKLMPKQRVRVETVMARSGPTQRTAPYGAIVYGPSGETWVYVNSAPRVYERKPVKVDYIVGDTAFLKDGPPKGTKVVTVGAAELYGEEIGIGH